MSVPIHKRKRRLPKRKTEPQTQVDLVEEAFGEGAVDELLQASEPKEKPQQRNEFISNGTTWKRTDTGGWSCYDPVQAIEGLQVDFLAYSYLYYYQDISLITDSLYDNICSWLVGHKKKEPEAFRSTKYYELCGELDESGSGFYIKKEDYPERILQVCKRLLLQHDKEVPQDLKDVPQPQEWDIRGWE